MIAIGIAIPLTELQAVGALAPNNAITLESGSLLDTEDGRDLSKEG